MSQHFFGMHEIASADRIADARAADAFAVEHDGSDRLEFEAKFRGFFLEKREVASSIFTKAPVFAHGDGANGSGGEFLNELGGVHVGEFLIKVKWDQKFHAKCCDQSRLVVKSFQEGRGSFIGSDDSDGMWVESQQTRHSALASSGLDRAVDDGLVADVDAIENPECQVQRGIKCGQVFQAFANQHAAR